MFTKISYIYNNIPQPERSVQGMEGILQLLRYPPITDIDIGADWALQLYISYNKVELAKRRENSSFSDEHQRLLFSLRFIIVIIVIIIINYQIIQTEHIAVDSNTAH